MFSSSNIQQ
jgi:hypothetical protein